MKNLQIEKDLPNKKITVTRHFEAAPEQVWRAWTEADLLDKWWAPKPWRAETKSMSFTEGGQWLYAMVGPEGEKHWAKVDFISIHPVKSFSAADSFCDENGNTNDEFPRMHWHNQFYVTDDGTKVVVEISFTKDADLETILTMGFESGFTSALTNLDDYF
eukprot:gene61752-84452_t